MARTAYFLFAHKNPDQLLRLLRLIYKPENIYLIHYDAKSAEAEYQKLRASATEPNVHFLERQPVYWGGDWSLYDVEFKAMCRLLQLDEEWTHFVNLSGQCFPLVPEEAVRAFLDDNQGRSFVERVDPDVVWGEKIRKQRFEERYFRFGRRYLYLPIKRPSPHVRWWGNSQFKILSREACDYLANDPEAARLRRYFAKALSPDEGYVGTALFNSPLANKVEVHYKHYIDWNAPRPPKILGVEDVPSMLASGAFWARKFDPDVDARVMDVLEERLKNWNDDPIPADTPP